MGYRRVEDADWLIPVGNDIWCILPRDTMEFLIAQEKIDDTVKTFDEFNRKENVKTNGRTSAGA